MATERIVIEVTERGAPVVSRNIKDIGGAARESHNYVNLLKGTLASIGGLLTARELLKVAEAGTVLDNRIRSVTNSEAELNTVRRETLRISQETRTSLEDNVVLYQRLRVATAELGISQSEILDVQELINKSLIVGGATATEASNALRQLTQGLASGALRGDEFRSVSEQLPFLLPLISRELGVATGELKKMAEQGKITTDVVINAFRNAREEIEGRFAKAIVTPSQALVVLKNSFIDVVREFNSGDDLTQGISAAILALARNLGVLTKTLVVGAAGWAAYRAAQFVSDRRSAIEATTKAVREQGIILTANLERDAQRAATAVTTARADLAAAEAAVARAEAEGVLAGSISRVAAAEAAQAIPERGEIAAIDADIRRIEAERSVAAAITQRTVADKAAAVAAHQSALATTEAALAAERAAAVEATRIAALAGGGRVVNPASAARIGDLNAIRAESSLALAEAQRELTRVEEALNTQTLAGAATETQLSALRDLRRQKSLALAAAETDLAIAQAATEAGDIAAADDILAKARLQRAVATGTLTAAEADLVVANRAVAASNAGIAATEPLLTRAIAGVRNMLRSLWATIVANPILFLVTGIAALTTALIINRDNIRLTGDSAATLGDVFRVLANDVRNLARDILFLVNQALKPMGIELDQLGPRGDTMAQKLARLLDLKNNPALAFTGGVGPAEAALKAVADRTDAQIAEIEAIANNFEEQRAVLEAALGGSTPTETVSVSGPRVFSFDEVKEAREQYEQLVSSVDDVAAATLRRRDAEFVLQTAVAAGVIKDGEKARVLGLLEGDVEKVTDTYAEMIDQYAEELRLLGLSEDKRRVEAEVLQALRKLKDDDKAATAAQIAEITRYVVAIDEATRAERNLADVRQARADADPREAARQSIEERRKVLAEGVRLGNVSLLEAVVLLKRYQDANADALDPVAAMNRAHEERIRLLALSAEAQAVEAEATQRRDALVAEGIPIHEVNLDLIRRQVVAERDLERQVETLDEVVQKYAGTNVEAARDVEILNAAIAAGEGDADALAAALRRAEIAMLSTSTTAGDGLRRGVLGLQESFADLGAQAEGALVNSFRAAEDALLEFFQTGKFEAKKFADAIISELLRIAIRQAILAPINNFLGGLFGQGGTVQGAQPVRFAAGGVVNAPELFTFAQGGAQRLGLRGEAGSEAIMPMRRAARPSVGAYVGDRVLDAPIGRLPNGDLGVDLTEFFRDFAMRDTRAFAVGGAFFGGTETETPRVSRRASSLTAPRPAPISGDGGGGRPQVTLVLNLTNNITIEAGADGSVSAQERQRAAQETASAINEAARAALMEFIDDQSRDGGIFANPRRQI